MRLPMTVYVRQPTAIAVAVVLLGGLLGCDGRGDRKLSSSLTLRRAHGSCYVVDDEGRIIVPRDTTTARPLTIRKTKFIRDRWVPFEVVTDSGVVDRLCLLDIKLSTQVNARSREDIISELDRVSNGQADMQISDLSWD